MESEMSARPRRSFFRIAAGGGALLALGPGVLRAGAARAQELRYFRIGTGPSGGTYHPIGTAIASAISNPPGSRPCDRGGSCGVPGLIATAQATQGSVQNIEELAAGRFDAAFAQADVAYWAHRAEAIYAGKRAFSELRQIATLYPELIHLVALAGSGISTVGDLHGKRVSLGEQGSGTLVHARLVLEAHGLAPEDLEAAYQRPGESADALRSGNLDAFFFVAGAPASAISALAESTDIALVPIAGAPIEPLRARSPFFTPARVLAGEYKNVGETPTLAVSTLLVTSARIDNDLIYGITKALWHPSTRELLDRAHPVGKRITLESALDSRAVPLHGGAERLYREIGKLPASRPDGDNGNNRKN
jgi:TRAP transporter TAXI family solute receptor